MPTEPLSLDRRRKELTPYHPWVVKANEVADAAEADGILDVLTTKAALRSGFISGAMWAEEQIREEGTDDQST